MSALPNPRTFRASRAGNAAVEFAFVLPVMLLVFGGIVEFGRAFQVYGAVNRLATRYALAWADCSDYPAGTCGTELSMYSAAAAIQNLVPQLTNTVTLRMIEIKMDGASNPTVQYAYPTGSTLTSSELTAAKAVIAANQYGVVVTVSYNHTLVLFQQLMSPFLGSSRAISYTVAQLKS